jgi:LysR family transcriptional regulator, chromosome initiation inhibitor
MSLLSANLQAFMAIVKRGTVHGAAGDLRLTQTGVTQRIRALERDLATTLFLRSRRGMRLTHEGEALLHYCRAAGELEGRAMSQIGGAGALRTVELTVVGPTSVMTARIANQCLPLYARWPRLYLNLVISDETDRLALVRAGQATMAIVPPEQVPNEMDSKRLRPDRYVLVSTPAWRGRRIADILEHERVIDFDEADPTSLNYLKRFDLIGRLKQPRLYANNNDVIIKLFAAGVGFGTLTQEIAAPHLAAGTLITLNGGAVMEDALALAWYPRPHPPEYFAALVKALR